MRNMYRPVSSFYDNGIKPYSMDLGEDWSNNEIIQAAAIGEFTSWMVLNGETVQRLQRMK